MIFIVVVTFVFIALFKTQRASIYKEILPIMENTGPKGLSCTAINPTKNIAYQQMLQLETKNEKNVL